jgi:hypothetical protein
MSQSLVRFVLNTIILENFLKIMRVLFQNYSIQYQCRRENVSRYKLSGLIGSDGGRGPDYLAPAFVFPIQICYNTFLSYKFILHRWRNILLGI